MSETDVDQMGNTYVSENSQVIDKVMPKEPLQKLIEIEHTAQVKVQKEMEKKAKTEVHESEREKSFSEFESDAKKMLANLSTRGAEAALNEWVFQNEHF